MHGVTQRKLLYFVSICVSRGCTVSGFLVYPFVAAVFQNGLKQQPIIRMQVNKNSTFRVNWCNLWLFIFRFVFYPVSSTFAAIISKT